VTFAGIELVHEREQLVEVPPLEAPHIDPEAGISPGAFLVTNVDLEAGLSPTSTMPSPVVGQPRRTTRHPAARTPEWWRHRVAVEQTRTHWNLIKGQGKREKGKTRKRKRNRGRVIAPLLLR
jgi:hypothetical protein